MTNARTLSASLQALEASYLTGDIPLNAVVHRAEALLEEGKAMLTPDAFLRAMNCVYLIEDVNALVLDEGRPLKEGERASIATELGRLVASVAES